MLRKRSNFFVETFIFYKRKDYFGGYDGICEFNIDAIFQYFKYFFQWHLTKRDDSYAWNFDMTLAAMALHHFEHFMFDNSFQFFRRSLNCYEYYKSKSKMKREKKIAIAKLIELLYKSKIPVKQKFEKILIPTLIETINLLEKNTVLSLGLSNNIKKAKEVIPENDIIKILEVVEPFLTEYWY